jgi:cob(I)alamin adenosyltransferase
MSGSLQSESGSTRGAPFGGVVAVLRSVTPSLPPLRQFVEPLLGFIGDWRQTPTPRDRASGEAAIVKIYTRKGDAGESGFFGGGRAPKDDPRFEALGALDELVACLGVAKAELADAGLKDRLTTIQGELYLAMAELASAGAPAAALPSDATSRLEAAIDELDARLPPLKDFVMPGESGASAALHVARTVCRRAERRVVSAGREGAGPSAVLVYLNRLSDLLFVMARAADHGEGDRTFKSAL